MSKRVVGLSEFGMAVGNGKSKGKGHRHKQDD